MKGQSIAEYMILIGIIIAAVIVMQTYAKRSVQAVIKVAADSMASQDVVFPNPEERFSQTSSTFAGSCSQIGGTCSSVDGTETTVEGLQKNDAIALTAPLTAGDLSGGNKFYYTAPTTTQSSATQSVRSDEMPGGTRVTQILQDQSSTALIGGSRTEYYEKE